MRVILVGAGVGGLTAALALSQRGVKTTIVERSPVLGEVGAGVQLSPNAARILFRLGLEARLRAVSFTPQAAEVTDRRTGRRLLRTELGQAAQERWGAPYLQIHRADLQEALLDALAGCPEVQLVLGARARALTQYDDGVSVDIEGAAEPLSGEALIGCDGIRSTVRAMLWGDQPARYTGQTAWRALVEAARLSPRRVPPLARVWTGAGKHFVHYPVRGGDLINLVGVVERRAYAPESWSEPGDKVAFAADFAGWPEPIGALIDAAGPVWRYSIHDRPPLPAWSSDRASLIGDAAHPAPPFLAQGAAMAIEDAEAVARHLASGASVKAALRSCEAERRVRTTRVQAWSRRNARLFHMPSPVALTLFAAVNISLASTGSSSQGSLDWLYGYRPPGAAN